MVREIVFLQVGQCGNKVGAKFWEVTAEEHGVDKTGVWNGDSNLQLERLNVFFNESNTGRWVPRTILTDLEAGAVDCVRASPVGGLFRPDNFVFGQSSAGNNWAKGFYGDGTKVSDVAMDIVRKECENCEVLQGFELCHSTGGGSGSGYGTYLMGQARNAYADRIFTSFSVYPSPLISDVVVEPYNAVFSIHQLIENADYCMNYENEALYYICTRTLSLTAPTYSDLNHLISSVMCSTTCSMRFPGQHNSDLRKLSVNLIPFPRLHFMITSFAPLTSRLSKYYQNLTVSELTYQIFSKRNSLSSADPRSGKYLCASAQYRGLISTEEMDRTLRDMLDRDSKLYVSWIPNNIKSSVCDVPHKGLEMSACFIANNTAIQDSFKRLGEQFSSLYRRAAFVHWYTAEGMDKSEFEEANSNVGDLVMEYAQYGADDGDEAEFADDE